MTMEAKWCTRNTCGKNMPKWPWNLVFASWLLVHTYGKLYNLKGNPPTTHPFMCIELHVEKPSLVWSDCTILSTQLGAGRWVWETIFPMGYGLGLCGFCRARRCTHWSRCFLMYYDLFIHLICWGDPLFVFHWWHGLSINQEPFKLCFHKNTRMRPSSQPTAQFGSFICEEEKGTKTMGLAGNSCSMLTPRWRPRVTKGRFSCPWPAGWLPWFSWRACSQRRNTWPFQENQKGDCESLHMVCSSSFPSCHASTHLSIYLLNCSHHSAENLVPLGYMQT